MESANPATPFRSLAMQTTRVLRIDSSANNETSVTRQLADLFIQRLGERESIQVASRDLAQGLPFLDAGWIAANFTDPAARDADKQAALALSDALVSEVQAADVLVIGMPIYNFGVPATLKVWIDMIARARVTFRYTEHGPEGLLTGKKAYLLVASGGTPVGGAIDFATPWLKHVLAFIGITDVEVIAAERLMIQGEAGRQQAVERIASVLQQAPQALAKAA
jgi:FMN-dependent NADH-azoreductase